MVENTWWPEKYRPSIIDDYVGNEEFISKVKHWIETNDPVNLILYSEKSGTGKCLDFSEEIDIEIELTEKEYRILKSFHIQ